MASKANINHAINYIEFSVVSLDEAKKFYGNAFGWQFSDYGPEYAGIKHMDGEGECGGICLVESVQTGGPLVILYAEDLERTYAAVKTAGGQIVTETFSFPGGRRFHFRDPSGNVLAVWSDHIADGQA